MYNLAISLLMGCNPIPESVLLPTLIGVSLARSHLKAAFTFVHLDTLALMSVAALCRLRG